MDWFRDFRLKLVKYILPKNYSYIRELSIINRAEVHFVGEIYIEKSLKCRNEKGNKSYIEIRS